MQTAIEDNAVPTVTQRRGKYELGQVYGIWKFIAELNVIKGEYNNKARRIRAKCTICGHERSGPPSAFVSGKIARCFGCNPKEVIRTEPASTGRNRRTPGHIVGHKVDDHLRIMSVLDGRTRVPSTPRTYNIN